MFKAVLTFVALFSCVAQAQMVDVRARSMRGRQAYPQGVAVRPQPAADAYYGRSDSAVRRERESGQSGTVDNPPRKVRQTGLKIFKEEDEGKVLNINVDNPEFDKLSDSRKQNILSRISYEEK